MATSAIKTGAEFDALPYEEGRRWELVGGELIPVPSPTVRHQLIAQRILFLLVKYLEGDPSRGLALADVEFALTENYRVRPDVLVLRDKTSSLDLDKVPVPGAPDLVVEVTSSSERSSDTQEKLPAYLRYGTQELWQVYPKSKSVMVHRGNGSVTLAAGSRIETSLLPGFSLDVAEFFHRGYADVRAIRS